ncbi:MAG: Sapep family Mn(2+)-dependent dipeptidase [Christensenellaceae bacterium]
MLDFSLASRKNEMIDALSKLIGIKSVKSEAQGNMPYGKGVFDALIKTLNIAEHMDFDSVNYFSHLGYVEYGDGEDVFAVLAHLDVVPAGDGWSVPPFEATIKDGKLYGRGAQDNKGPAIAALFALSAIKENCVSLNKRVRIIFGCDEESGWSDIDFYKKNCGEIPTMAISNY